MEKETVRKMLIKSAVLVFIAIGAAAFWAGILTRNADFGRAVEFAEIFLYAAALFIGIEIFNRIMAAPLVWYLDRQVKKDIDELEEF